MESIGGAGSLLAIIGFTLQSVKTIYKTTESIKDGPSTLGKLTSVAKELGTILDQLSNLVPCGETDRQLAGMDIWEPIVESISRCRDDVCDLERVVADLGINPRDRIVGKIWKRLKTSLKDKDFEKMWRTMQFHVGAIGLHLNAIQRLTRHHEMTNSSFRGCSDQMTLHSNSIMALVTDRTDTIHHSIKDLTVQAQNCAGSSNQVLVALGTATKNIALRLKIDSATHHQATRDDIQSVLDSKLDGVEKSSRSEHDTILVLFSQIQKTVSERFAPLDVTPSTRSRQRYDLHGHEVTPSGGLMASVARLNALAPSTTSTCGSDAAQAIIEELDHILDRLLTHMTTEPTITSESTRIRISDNDGSAVALRDFKTMKGLVLASQVIDLQSEKPRGKVITCCESKLGLKRSFTFMKMEDCHALIRCSRRRVGTGDSPCKKRNICRSCNRCFEGIVEVFPKAGFHQKKLLVSFYQQYTSIGFRALNPSISFHARIPCKSDIYSAIRDGNMKWMLKLFSDGEAALTDCDIRGRSLLGYAIFCSRLDICRFLIGHGADVDALELARYPEGEYKPLLRACKHLETSYKVEAVDGIAIQKCLLEAGADPMAQGFHTTGFREAGENSLWSMLRQLHISANELDIFLTHGAPSIDVLATDQNGANAMFFLLSEAVSYWSAGYKTAKNLKHLGMYPAKLATLLHHGADPRSRGPDGLTSLHACFDTNYNTPTREDGRIYLWAESLIECLCILITQGAEIYAVNPESGLSVTEHAHLLRYGQLWEHALKLCSFDVYDVYAQDHTEGSEVSNDVYAPTRLCPRRQGPMDNNTNYYDSCSKGSKGCIIYHESWQSAWEHASHNVGERCRDLNGKNLVGAKEWRPWYRFHRNAIDIDRFASVFDGSDEEREDDSGDEPGGVSI